jgi:hypothetical protein
MAKKVSGSALKRASEESEDPEVRIAAHNELRRRESEEKGGDESNKKDSKIDGDKVMKDE